MYLIACHAWKPGAEATNMPLLLPFFCCIMSHAHVSLWSEVPVFVSFVLWSGHSLAVLQGPCFPSWWVPVGLWVGSPCGSCKAGWDSVHGSCSGAAGCGCPHPSGWEKHMLLASGYHQPSPKAVYTSETGCGVTGSEMWGVDAVFCISLLTDSRLPLVSPDLSDKVVQNLC